MLKKDQSVLKAIAEHGGYDQALRQAAIDAFAVINGWKPSKGWRTIWLIDSSGGDLFCNAPRKYRSCQSRENRWFDHPLCFSFNGKPIAIVGQPYYDHLKPKDLPKLRGKIREKTDVVELQWHVPPVPLASIHAPGCTGFYVLTRPGVKVRWLPEQVVGIGLS